MADFCNKCSEEHFGNSLKPEIDVFEVFESLNVNYVKDIGICEGCGLVSVAKTEKSELKVLRVRYDDNFEREYSGWENY